MNNFLKLSSRFLIILSFLILTGLSSCKQEEFNVSNLNNGEILKMGHGGMGTGLTIYPTNTLTSIKKCFALNADGSEMDIQLTKDSVLILYHDEYLPNNKSKIRELNWDEIKGEYYSNFLFMQYPIVSLEELFTSIENIEEHYYILDIKMYPEKMSPAYKLSFVRALSKVISKYDLFEKVFIEGHNQEFLHLLSSYNRDFKVFVYPSSFEEGLEIAKRMGLYGITISTDKISKEQVEIAHENGLYISLWQANSRVKNREAIQKNPDIIQSDRIAHLIDLLN